MLRQDSETITMWRKCGTKICFFYRNVAFVDFYNFIFSTLVNLDSWQLTRYKSVRFEIFIIMTKCMIVKFSAHIHIDADHKLQRCLNKCSSKFTGNTCISFLLCNAFFVLLLFFSQYLNSQLLLAV